MKYWIAGADGQLGKEWVKYLLQMNIPFVKTGSKNGDITDRETVINILREQNPLVCINCSAYNQVDLAEIEYERAFAVNEKGPRILAEECLKNGVFLVHYSTDFVFDGNKEGALYVEEDKVNPLSVYAKSKLAGENAVLSANKDSLVFRVSWVFGPGTQNFAYKTVQWAKKMEYLKVAHDEFSIPTYTKWIVRATQEALVKQIRGLYHLTSIGFCSRFEYSTEVLRILNIPKVVYPVSTKVFPLPAKRPYCSPLDPSKLCGILNIKPNLWRDDLKEFLTGEDFNI